MDAHIILKQNPKIEFQILEQGFNLTDKQTEQNSGFYAYSDLQSVKLDHAWFPRLAKWLRVFTWILNGVPLLQDGESYKKAKLMFYFKKTKLGIWLTDPNMADQAKTLKKLLDSKKEPAKP